MVWYWGRLHRQVRVEGSVEKTPLEESKKYFQSRPIQSQISAAVSDQSQVIKNRAMLEEKYLQRANDYLRSIGAHRTVSDPIKEGRKEHVEIVKMLADLLKTPPIDHPGEWGGFIIKPTLVEFWEQGPFRLHNRVQYKLSSNVTDEWTIHLLAP